MKFIFTYSSSNVNSGMVPLRDGERHQARIRIQFQNKDFKDLKLDEIPTPLFSFIDPFGIKDIPMDAIR